MRGRYTFIIIAIMLFAAVVRFANLGFDSFAHDEAIRANRTHHGPVADGRWIPPLSYLTLRTMQHTLGRQEWLLRGPFALAGVVCVLLLYQLARRHLNEGSAVLIAALAACHPVLVLYSRSIKVFSAEAMFCALLFLMGMKAYTQRTRRALLGFVACALAAVGFTFTGSLVTAAWLVVLAWAYLRRRGDAKPEIACFTVSCFVLAIAVAGCYLWLSGGSTVAYMKSYYDTQEIAWPIGYDVTTLVAWLASSVKGATLYILNVSRDWPPISWCAAALQVLAVGLSFGVMWKRCRPLCIVVAILGVEVVLAGAMRIWPLGRMRHVTYLVPLATIFIGGGLWEFTRRFRWSPATAVIVGACVGLPFVSSLRTTLISPRVTEHIRPVIEHVRDNIQPGDAIFVYYGASDAFEFYVDHDEILRAPDDKGPAKFLTVEWNGFDVPVLVEPVSDRQNTEAFQRRFDEWADDHRRVWFIFAHNWHNEHSEWTDLLSRRFDAVEQVESVNASVHLFAHRSPATPDAIFTERR